MLLLFILSSNNENINLKTFSNSRFTNRANVLEDNEYYKNNKYLENSNTISKYLDEISRNNNNGLQCSYNNIGILITIEGRFFHEYLLRCDSNEKIYYDSPGSKFQNGSFCAYSTLTKELKRRDLYPSCYQMKCSKDNELILNIFGTRRKCRNNEHLYFSGFQGYFNCPDPKIICKTSLNNNKDLYYSEQPDFKISRRKIINYFYYCSYYNVYNIYEPREYLKQSEYIDCNTIPNDQELIDLIIRNNKNKEITFKIYCHEEYHVYFQLERLKNKTITIQGELKEMSKIHLVSNEDRVKDGIKLILNNVQIYCKPRYEIAYHYLVLNNSYIENFPIIHSNQVTLIGALSLQCYYFGTTHVYQNELTIHSDIQDVQEIHFTKKAIILGNCCNKRSENLQPDIYHDLIISQNHQNKFRITFHIKMSPKCNHINLINSCGAEFYPITFFLEGNMDKYINFIGNWSYQTKNKESIYVNYNEGNVFLLGKHATNIKVIFHGKKILFIHIFIGLLSLMIILEISLIIKLKAIKKKMKN